MRTKGITREIDQRDVYRYYPDLKVVARPVDSYVAPVRSNGATKLAESLGMVVGGARVAAGFMESRKDQARQAGVEAALYGKEAPEDTGGFLSVAGEARKAFMQTKAETESVRLAPEIARIAEEAQDEQEFIERSHSLVQDTLDSYGSDPHFTAYVSPRMEKMIGTAQASMINRWRKEEQANTLRDQGTVLAATVRTRMEALVPQGETLSSIKRNPEAYQEFQARVLKDSGEISGMLRGVLTDLQKRNATLGLTKDQMSVWYLNAVGQMAVEYGAPELLEFAKVPDSGVLLSDRFSERFQPLYERAVNAREQMEVQTEIKQRKYRTGIQEKLQGQMVQAMVKIRGIQDMPEGPDKEQALSASRQEMDAILHGKDFEELGSFAPAVAYDFLGKHAKAFEVQDKDLEDPAVVNEGYRRIATGELTSDWVLANLDYLGSKAYTFASRIEAKTNAAAQTAEELERSKTNTLRKLAEREGATFAEMSLAPLKGLVEQSFMLSDTIPPDVDQLFTSTHTGMIREIIEERGEITPQELAETYRAAVEVTTKTIESLTTREAKTQDLKAKREELEARQAGKITGGGEGFSPTAPKKPKEASQKPKEASQKPKEAPALPQVSPEVQKVLETVDELSDSQVETPATLSDTMRSLGYRVGPDGKIYDAGGVLASGNALPYGVDLIRAKFIEAAGEALVHTRDERGRDAISQLTNLPSDFWDQLVKAFQQNVLKEK